MVVTKPRETKIDSNCIEDSQSFSLANNANLFSILSDALYTDKISAVIREICCNAYDAHIDAGQSKPFLVKFPSYEDSEFRVRDYGKGLSPSDMSMYTTYGLSSKLHSNKQIGAFGIGAKSPFAYTHTFNVTSHQSGVSRCYVMHYENQIPAMTFMGEDNTGEPDGLEVSFDVRTRDIDEFLDKGRSVLVFLCDKISFEGVDTDWLESLRSERDSLNFQSLECLGKNYYQSGLHFSSHYSTEDFAIIQGNVRYRMTHNEITEIYERLWNDGGVKQRSFSYYLHGMLQVPNGTFMPHPSREMLSFSDDTRSKLEKIFKYIYSEFIINQINRVTSDSPSYIKLYQRVMSTSFPEFLRDSSELMDYQVPGMSTSFKDFFSEATVYCWRPQVLASGAFSFYCSKGLHVSQLDWDKVYVIQNAVQLRGAYRYALLEEFNRQTPDFHVSHNHKYYVVLEDPQSQFFAKSDWQEFPQAVNLPIPSLLDRQKWIRRRVTSKTTSFDRQKFSKIFITEYYTELYDWFYDPDKPADPYTFWLPAKNKYETTQWPSYASDRDDLNFSARLIGDRKWLKKNFAFLESTDLLKGSDHQYSVLILPEGHPARELYPEFVPTALMYAKKWLRSLLVATDYSINAQRGQLAFIKQLLEMPDLFKSLTGHKYKRVFSYFTEHPDIDTENYNCDTHYIANLPNEYLLKDRKITALLARLKQVRSECVIDITTFFSSLCNRFPLLQEGNWWRCERKGEIREVCAYMRWRMSPEALIQLGKPLPERVEEET